MRRTGTGADRRFRDQCGRRTSRTRRLRTGSRTRRLRTGLLVTVAALVSFAIPACEADEPPRRELRTPEAEAPARMPGPETPQEPIVVVLDEWRIYFDPHDVDAGRHEFLVVNEGIYTHSFTVERGDDRWETPAIPPGGQASLVVDLQAGTYEVYCPIEDEHGDHSELGMRDTLEVGEA